MSDEQLVKERLELILEHTAVLIERISLVPDADWFTSTKEGELLFDSLIARLQPIGENIKKIEKVKPGFTKENLQLLPENIIRFRDLISHHYELLDPQIIFNICKNDIVQLRQAVLNYLNVHQ